METITEFKDLKFPGTDRLVSSFDFTQVCGETRIYYSLNKPNEKVGFDFYITEFHSACADNEKYEDPYKSPGFQATCLFWGHVYWDGLRHLYMGDKETETENYLYYANTLDLAQIFEKLRELETQFCRKDQLVEKTS